MSKLEYIVMEVLCGIAFIIGGLLAIGLPLYALFIILNAMRPLSP